MKDDWALSEIVCRDLAIEALREERDKLREAVKRLLMHVGLHGMPTAALEQDAEFARAALQEGQ